MFFNRKEKITVNSLAGFSGHIIKMSEIPNYSELFSSVDNEQLPLNEKDRYSMALLKHDDGLLSFLIVEDQNAIGIYRRINRLLEDCGLFISRIYTCDSHVVVNLYQNVFAKPSDLLENETKDAFHQIIDHAIEDSVININVLALPNRNVRVTFEIHKQVVTYNHYKFDHFLEMTNAYYNGFDDKSPSEFSPTSICDATCYHDYVNDNKTRRFRVRWSSVGSFSKGYDITIRLLETGMNTKHFASLGYDKPAIDVFDRLSRLDQGLIIFSGPMGSGKTTAGMSFVDLYLINHNQRKKVITVEDPPEIIHPATHPTTVLNDRWSDYTKNLLRRAPHAVYYGEIRDQEVASQAMRMSQSGHLICTTLHAADPIQALILLKTLYKIDLTILTMPGVLRAIISQKLVPILCPECNLSISDVCESLPDYMLEGMENSYSFDLSTIRFENNSSECSACKGRGRIGLQPIYELFLPSKEVIDEIANGDFRKARDVWMDTDVNHGVDGVTFAKRASDLVLQHKLCGMFAYSKVLMS